MGAEDTEIDEEFGYRFGYHRATAVGGMGVRRGAVAVEGVVEEVFCHGRVLSRGDQPAGDIAGEDIEDDVTFIPDPFHGSFQRGDIPGPHLTRAVGDELGTHPGRVGGNAAAFPYLPGGTGDPVHRGHRAPVPAFVELTGPHLGNREVAVGRAGQQFEHQGPFGGVEGLRRWRAGQPRAVHRAFRIDVAVVGRPRRPGQRAGFLHRYVHVTQFGEGGGHNVLGSPSLSVLSESCSKSACAFPIIPSANLVFARSDSNFSFRRRSFSNSINSADFFARFTGDADSAGLPDKTPASRALVHSTIWEEYRPSRRRIAPFSPLGAFSYSATMASLSAGVNPRRVGRGAGSLPPAGTLGCLSDGVGTCTRISGPALPIRDPTLTRGVSRHPAREGSAPRVRHRLMAWP